ncbi:GNAT family N-acetyltransferase [Microbacterium sp. NPDC055910]|uniref:GNAT family N-acetyltransferase n=1 Tax=Microbacterium sp. NPDC055910 TaxID=3345659 RepID=UPI0035E31822
MTDLLHADDTVGDARAAAHTAARAAGVTVREISNIAEEHAVVELLCGIWGRSAENPPMAPELLRAFAKAGNYIGGAFDGDELIGAAVAFHASPDRHAMHSHIAGVRDPHGGRSVGFALKLHQRGWALERDIEAIEWTFDPLISRNAYFNVEKLRARPLEYLPNFYGAMSDAINGDDETDRLLVRWELNDDVVRAAASGSARRIDPRAPGHVSVALPERIEQLRSSDPARARVWRRDVREQLSGLLAAGGRIVGYDRAAGYIVKEGDSR